MAVALRLLGGMVSLQRQAHYQLRAAQIGPSTRGNIQCVGEIISLGHEMSRTSGGHAISETPASVRDIPLSRRGICHLATRIASKRGGPTISLAWSPRSTTTSCTHDARHCADPDDAFRYLDGLMAWRYVNTDEVTLPQYTGGSSEHHRLLLLSNVDRYHWQVVRAMQPELGLSTRCCCPATSVWPSRSRGVPVHRPGSGARAVTVWLCR